MVQHAAQAVFRNLSILCVHVEQKLELLSRGAANKDLEKPQEPPKRDVRSWGMRVSLRLRCHVIYEFVCGIEYCLSEIL